MSRSRATHVPPLATVLVLGCRLCTTRGKRASIRFFAAIDSLLHEMQRTRVAIPTQRLPPMSRQVCCVETASAVELRLLVACLQPNIRLPYARVRRMFSAMDKVAQALRLLRPGELFPLWSLVDRLEQVGDISPAEATLWKDGIFEAMVLRGLEAEDVISQSPREGSRSRQSAQDQI